jgi:hypothetical protein
VTGGARLRLATTGFEVGGDGAARRQDGDEQRRAEDDADQRYFV